MQTFKTCSLFLVFFPHFLQALTLAATRKKIYLTYIKFSSCLFGFRLLLVLPLSFFSQRLLLSHHHHHHHHHRLYLYHRVATLYFSQYRLCWLVAALVVARFKPQYLRIFGQLHFLSPSLSGHVYPTSLGLRLFRFLFVRLRLDCFRFGQAFSLIFQQIVYVSVSMSYLPIFPLGPRIKYWKTFWRLRRWPAKRASTQWHPKRGPCRLEK